MIHVSPLSRLPETVSRTGATRLVTLLKEGTPFARPSAIAANRHLMLLMHDILEEREGFVAPSRTHVAALVSFARAWEREAPLVINCFAGVSRSTAAAYVIAAALAPERDEGELAATLRAMSPSATPNIRIVALADELLGREGRMTRAIEAIGRGADCFEGEPFELAI